MVLKDIQYMDHSKLMHIDEKCAIFTYVPVKVSQFDMRRVVPSLLRMIGPHSSKLIFSPSLMDRRFELGSDGRSRGTCFPPSIGEEKACTFSFDPAIVMALVRNTIRLVSRIQRRILNFLFKVIL